MQTILQFGTGNFLRAFTDLMVHEANRAGVLAAGIVVVPATPGRNATLERLRAQGGHYHVLLEGVRDGEPVREITRVESITRTVYPDAEFDDYRAAYLDPALTVIVSNTTEAGIVWADGDDLTARPPRTFPAQVTALLHDRWAHFDGARDKGLHLVCCELIEDNATTLRALVLRHAAANGLPTAFTDWVRTACAFHDSLVDRIVPGFPHDDAEAIWAELGTRDELVVKAEAYGLWAIAADPDDAGPGTSLRDLLPLDRAGQPVQFVTDLRPLRAAKVRILNGLHTAMAPVGLLAGRDEVRTATANLTIAGYLGHLLHGEILPSLPQYEESEEAAEALADLADAITERFANPFLHHRLADIALNSLSKWRTRNLPVLLDAWAAGREAPMTVLSFAALAVLYSGRGLDASRVASIGFEVRDDPALVAAVSSAFPPSEWASGADDDAAITRWLRTVIDAAALFADAPDGIEGIEGIEGTAPADRLATEATPLTRRILDEGITTTLKSTT
jgi:tagaturonate reductase